MNKKEAKTTLLILKKHLDHFNIPFSLGFGTLLGVVRENNFITGDKDIDLIFDLKYKKKVELLFFLLKQEGFDLKLNKKNYCFFVRNGVHVDFYFFSQRNFADKLFKRVSCSYGLWCIFIPLKFYKRKQYSFLGKNFFGLPKEWLTYTYGDWRVPESKRGSRSRTFTSFYLMSFRDYLKSFFSDSVIKKVRVVYKCFFK